jgi:hypothetical protein
MLTYGIACLSIALPPADLANLLHRINGHVRIRMARSPAR